ncbi:tRNA lysidine(34) synthetase TilS [Luteococcus peritonei]|uniref:tRNA(Ile)-lysidine synthase n=1 Tax=Luteococcus peritonei TaxID=88874 RepID=A0ABW4RWT5_9ACTN
MARRMLTPAQLQLVQVVRPHVNAPLVRIGCSGGADSLALVAAAAACRGEATTLEAVVVDHGLQENSAEAARSTAAVVENLGVHARLVRVDVVDDGHGLEAAAREARLAALAGDRKAPVLLGHTLDDQAETVLLGLGRGSGPASLQAMAERRDVFVRPLLGVRRAVTRQACKDWGLPVWEDPMNSDLRFRRVRVRNQLVPIMEDVLGGGVVEALGRTASMLRADNHLIDELARQQATEDCSELARLHPALRSRVLRSWLLRQGVPEPSHGHVQAVEQLVTDWHGQSGLDLPGGVRVQREDGRLVAAQTPAG